MKIELCSFSGFKIYPGHGKRAVKTDGRESVPQVEEFIREYRIQYTREATLKRVFQFVSAKTERSHMMKRNPRNISWTVLYRRKHKKGISEEITKKRTRRTTKFQRAITGATLNDIMAKRNQKPEVRKAQREQAIRAAKEKNKAKEAAKKAQKTAQAKSHQKSQQKAAKVVQSKAPRVGGKR